MCLRFWCCFGPAPGDDDDYCCSSPASGSVPQHHHAVPAKTTTTPHHHAPPPTDHRNGHYHHLGGAVPHHANGHHKAHHHHHQLPLAEEEYRKASNDLRRGHAGAAIKGVGHGYAAPAAYVYSAPEDAVKQAATNAVVVADAQGRSGGAHHSYPADHHYSTTTAATYNFHR